MTDILYEDALDIARQDIRWDKLRDSKVLVTGASGMLGSYIARTLLTVRDQREMQLDVYALVRNPSKLPEDIRNEVNVICQDVTKPVDSDVKFDYVFHAASPASPMIMKDDPVGTIAANTLGAYYTLDLARHTGAKGYMFISSREIYGQPYEGQREFSEDTYGFVDPISPRSCYPEGKKAAETMCASFAQQYGLPAKIARLAHTYGPGMSIDDGRVQADFLRDVVNHRDIVLKSEGKPIRTYTYVGDAAAALFWIMFNADDMVYNISSPESTVSIRELAETLVAAYPERKLHLEFDIPEEETNTGSAPFTLGILNSDKLRALGWRPRYSLREGLMRTVAYLESQ